ncbi:hypothetical protein CK203_114520 [Vitis vinifera]|uniref:Uncharacterized protein n=1 Tax=Vitis vinifera TaxID=29760 RepID=A0A438FDM5_VITVI|nr:hypothetical protein CK203_114520 [Vitis vinifera]
MKSQPNAPNAKAGMYTVNEDIDMKAKHLVEECPTIPAVREVFGDQENVIGQFKPNNNASYGNTYNSNWRNHPNFSWKPRAPQYTQLGQAPPQASNLEQAIVNLSKVVGDFVGDQKSIDAQLSQRIDSVESTLNKMMDGMQNDQSQKIDNLQYSISRLTNLNIVQEKGKFLSQPHQNPKGIHEVEAQEGRNLHRNGVMQLTFSNMTLELNIFYCARNNSIRKKKKDQKSLGDLDEGLPKPSDFLATLHTWKKGEEILPLFNGKETQEAIKEKPQKLILKPLPTELKYAYLEENKQILVVISSSLTT